MSHLPFDNDLYWNGISLSLIDWCEENIYFRCTCTKWSTCNSLFLSHSCYGMSAAAAAGSTPCRKEMENAHIKCHFGTIKTNDRIEYICIYYIVANVSVFLILRSVSRTLALCTLHQHTHNNVQGCEWEGRTNFKNKKLGWWWGGVNQRRSDQINTFAIINRFSTLCNRRYISNESAFDHLYWRSSGNKVHVFFSVGARHHRCRCVKHLNDWAVCATMLCYTSISGNGALRTISLTIKCALIENYSLCASMLLIICSFKWPWLRTLFSISILAAATIRTTTTPLEPNAWRSCRC